MKKLPVVSALIILLSVFCYDHLAAQTGTTCNNPIELNSPGTWIEVAYSSHDRDVWIEFTAPSSSIVVTVSDSITHADSLFAHIRSLKIYSGTCGTLQLVAGDSVGHGTDTLPILRIDNLATNEKYCALISGFNLSNGCSICNTEITYFAFKVRSIELIEADMSDCVACGLNLVSNGDFETPQYPNVTPYQLYGPSSSDMTFTTSFSPYVTNMYSVSRNAVPPHSSVEAIDHTTGSGYFLWGDSKSHLGANSPYRSVAWEQDVNVHTGNTYIFSVWIKDVGVDYGVHWTKFRLKIGSAESDWFDNGSSKTWHKFCFKWTADVTGTVTLKIINEGNYDQFGCDFGIDDIEFRERTLDAPLIFPSIPIPVCPGQAVTLTATGGATYDWSTGETTQTITVNPLATSTYSVIAHSDVPGCEGNGSMITIFVNQPPSAGFSFSSLSPCTNVAVSFTNTSTSNLSMTYSWDFGDGSTASTATNPLHTYSAPGTYTVTLSATNSCGTTSVTGIIQVAPSSDAYNANCCSSDPSIEWTYDQTTGGPIVITAPLNGPQYWTGVNYLIRGTVTIMPGAKLIIDGGSTVQFDPYSKIVVSPGGILEVQSSTLTGLQTCGTMWQGIEVWGNKTKTQTQLQNTATGQLYEGKVIINNSTIELAHNGVVLGRAQTTQYDPASGGGILLATSANFVNCGYGVRFIPYPFVNNSRIIDCDFSSTTLPDPGYNNVNGYTYPNSANALYAYANPNQRTYSFVQAMGVQFVQVMDNTFDNSEYGIIGINASLRVGDGDNDGLGNDFLNINNGELHGNIFNAPFYGNRIERNRYNTTVVPAQIWNGMADRVTENRILGAFVGVGMVSSQALTINDNVIGTLSASCLVGISVNNSGIMGGLIGRTGTGNTFTQCVNGTSLSGSNINLQIHCNNYINPSSSNYNRNWYNGGPLANQGYLPILTDKDPAGNTFAQFTPLRNQLFSTFLFDYYAYSADPSGNPVTVIPTPSAVTGNVLTPANMINTGIQQTSTSCDPEPPCANCSSRLSQLDEQVSELEAEKVTVEGMLDGGQPAVLLNAINSEMTGSALEILLLANSPLSDEVLLAFINRAGTPPVNFENVIIANSPVSIVVRPALYEAIAGMAAEQNMIDAQSNTSNRTLAVVNTELQAAIGARQQVFNQQLVWFADQLETDSTMVDSIYASLLRQGTESALEALAASYLAQEDYTSAATVIALLDPKTEEEVAERDLLLLLHTVYVDNRDIFTLTASEEADVREIAGMEKECLARTNAKVILFAAFGEPLELEFDFSEERHTKPLDTTSIKSTSFLGESYPNPARTTVNMECNVPSGATANLRIFDMNGKLVFTKQIIPGKQVITIQTNNWLAGVYMCSLDTDTENIGLQKIVIVE